MRAFDYPTTSTIPRNDRSLALLLAPTAHMRLIVACEQFLVHGWGVLGRI
jgi:hypothetical protein